MASRHLSRISVLQALFASDMRNSELSLESVTRAYKDNIVSHSHDEEDRPFSDTLIRGIIAKRNDIDAVIQKSAPQWPLSKIAPIDRNILRIGLFELLFGSDASVPPKVALNESIELAKTFGGDSSSRFVNGVLGAVYKEMGSPRKEEAPKPVEENAKEYLAGIVVCAAVQNEMYVALVQDPFGKWTVPKTRYEKGELSDSAAFRAAEEELGITLSSLKAPLGEHEYEAHDPTARRVVVRRVGYFVACSKKQPLRPKEGKHIAAAGWFSEHDLASLPLYDDLRAIIASGIVVAHEECL